MKLRVQGPKLGVLYLMVRRSLESKINKVYLRCSKNYHGLQISSQRLKGETNHGTGSASCLGVEKDLELDLWVTSPAWYLSFRCTKLLQDATAQVSSIKCWGTTFPRCKSTLSDACHQVIGWLCKVTQLFSSVCKAFFEIEIRVAVKLPVKRQTRAFESTKRSGRFFW